MYLHVGNSDMLLLKDVIGIFNIDTLRQSKENKKILEKMEKEKTLFLVSRLDKTEEYFSNISVSAIQKRIKKGEYELIEKKQSKG